MNKYVIIGNGVSSIGCIEGIRSVDKESPITVISEEKYMTYARPLISYYLEGKTDLQKIKYRDDSYYENNNVTVYYSCKAVKIDSDKKTVFLEKVSGADDDISISEKKNAPVGKSENDIPDSISYTKLCICTGSTPFVPPFKGIETVENKHSFMTLDDALLLDASVNKDSKVLIVGAGLIGLKCAEGLAKKVASITVCDLADRVLSSILDTVPAGKMQSVLEEHGVRFMLSNSVAEFQGNLAIMQDGTKIDFDVLVLAVGVKANTALAKDIGCDVNRGIVIDEHCMTTVSAIYAAGDCSEGDDITFGSKRVLAILPNAFLQGECAGKNMAGQEFSFLNAIPMNSIGFFGLHAMSAGSYIDEENGGTLYDESDEESIRRFYVKDGKLNGYMLVGDVTRGGIFTSLIREQVPLSTIDFDLLRSCRSLAAFDASVRKKKLGTKV